MAKVRLRGQENQDSMATMEEQAPAEPVPLRPIPITALIVRAEALVEALRIYIPTLESIETIENPDGTPGELFLLRLRPTAEG